MDGGGQVWEGNWREAAARLGGLLPVSRLHPEAVRLLENADPAARWGVACSGGADSVCLALLLFAHWPDFRQRLHILSFDHRLRGGESAGDTAFTRTLAEGLGVGFAAGAWERADPAEPVSEETARAARLAFLEQAIGGPPGAWLFFGHQRDDVAETLLMRLARGSGAEGLSAPKPVSEPAAGPVRVRPMLTLSAVEIRDALRAAGVPWREDASNRGDRFFRNRIRRRVLPAWIEVSPQDALAGAARSREWLGEDDRALWAWLREKVPPPGPATDLGVEALREAPRALHRRALLEWLGARGLGGIFARAAVEAMVDDLACGRSFKRSAGAGAFLVFDGKVLRREPEAEKPDWVEGEWVLPWGGTLALPGGRSIAARGVILDAPLREWIRRGGPDPEKEAFVDRAAWTDGAFPRVRHWRPGDRFRPLGAPGGRKLQDLFSDRKLASGERRRLPLVLAGDRVLWIPGWPPVDSVKIKKTTAQVAHLTYQGARSG